MCDDAVSAVELLNDMTGSAFSGNRPGKRHRSELPDESSGMRDIWTGEALMVLPTVRFLSMSIVLYGKVFRNDDIVQPLPLYRLVRGYSGGSRDITKLLASRTCQQNGWLVTSLISLRDVLQIKHTYVRTSVRTLCGHGETSTGPSAALSFSESISIPFFHGSHSRKSHAFGWSLFDIPHIFLGVFRQ